MQILFGVQRSRRQAAQQPVFTRTELGEKVILLVIKSPVVNQQCVQVSYDHRSYQRNSSNYVQKPEKVRTSTGFEPVTTNTNNNGHSLLVSSNDHSLLDFKSAVQYMKHFIYHFTSILHMLTNDQLPTSVAAQLSWLERPTGIAR